MRLRLIEAKSDEIVISCVRTVGGNVIVNYNGIGVVYINAVDGTLQKMCLLDSSVEELSEIGVEIRYSDLLRGNTVAGDI